MHSKYLFPGIALLCLLFPVLLPAADVNGGEEFDKLPLLIVNGDLDDLAPVSDLHLLADSGQETDLWIMGGDQHCFGQYRSVVMPKMAAWLVSKLPADNAAKRPQ
jgi:hypothetical protein